MRFRDPAHRNGPSRAVALVVEEPGTPYVVTCSLERGSYSPSPSADSRATPDYSKGFATRATAFEGRKRGLERGSSEAAECA